MSEAPTSIHKLNSTRLDRPSRVIHYVSHGEKTSEISLIKIAIKTCIGFREQNIYPMKYFYVRCDLKKTNESLQDSDVVLVLSVKRK